MANRGGTEGRTDGRTDGHMEIPPCVLQDIGSLGPLPKKKVQFRKYEMKHIPAKNSGKKANVAY